MIMFTFDLRPCELKSSLWVTASKDHLEIETFKAAAEKDYEQFLINRAKELVPGVHYLFLLKTIKTLLM